MAPQRQMIAYEEETHRLRPPLRIGGMVPLTTLDYPDHLACVLFCQGCAWRCRYCHNPELIPPRGREELDWESIVSFLHRRTGLLQAVVFSGGEPTLQRGLPHSMEQVRELGYLVGMHSAGIKPPLFAQALKWADWVGFDIKALPEDHQNITGTGGSAQANWDSLDLLLKSGIRYEVRTTVHWYLFNPEMLLRLARRLRSVGVEHFVVQWARSENLLDPTLPGVPSPPPGQEQALWNTLKGLFPHFTLRGR